MEDKIKENLPAKGFPLKAEGGLARWGGRGIAGVTAPSSSDCYRISTWNVRSLHKSGKLANVIKEMARMEIDIMGVTETCWKGEGVFTTNIPGSEENYQIIYSGGKINRRGVGIITKETATKSILFHTMISERIMVIRLKATPVNILIIQVYAPCEDSKDEEKENFYEMVDQVIKDNRKGRECLIVMGDLNGKVGDKREQDIIGPYGRGDRNENGQHVIDLCATHNLFAANTWFQQKKSAQHTWTSPDGNTKNQIDFILFDKRYRNGVRNCKVRPEADCESDHNPVVATINIKLRKTKRNKGKFRWNTAELSDAMARKKYQSKIGVQLKARGIDDEDDIEQIWKKLKDCVTEVAMEICGKEKSNKKQNLISSEILEKMEERRKCKINNTEEGIRKYKELKRTIQKLCRTAKDNYYNEKCQELEQLDKLHSPRMYKKIKELQPRTSKTAKQIRDRQGKTITEKNEIVERWAEYVEELYEDKERGEADMGDLVNEVYTISEKEIQEVIKGLPKGKACGEDNISAELLQYMGEEGIQTTTRLINKIYKSGYIPEDFRKSIFVPIPKVAKAQDCSDFRTITLISHTSKILLNLIKKRISPIVERHLSDSQMGFRKGKGTRDAIFQLRTICERSLQMGNKIYICFIDFQKAFDRVQHDKLVQVMEKVEIPELERRLIINLYWGQQATVRWENEASRTFDIKRGVRQGCILSPLLFNLYSEFMISEALEDTKGITFNGVDVTNLRYADDAALTAESEKNLQSMMDKMNATCKAYGMAINIKKTKVMVVSQSGGETCKVTLENVVLEQVARYKYLGSWITENARNEDEIKTRIALAKEAFWKNKEIMRRNIRPQTKMKILNSYVFSILNYGCETWTWNEAMKKKVDAFEQWCYRRMLKISWKDRVTNVEVLTRLQTKMHFLNDMKRRKLEYAGHVLRGSSGETHLLLLEGKVNGKRPRARPRHTWIDDIAEWTEIERYDQIKRTAEDRKRWKAITVNLLQRR